MAENIKAKRILEMQDSHFNMHTGFKSQADFLDYFKSLVKDRRKQEGNYGNWMSAYKHLLAYSSDIQVWTIKDNYRLGSDITQKYWHSLSGYRRR